MLEFLTDREIYERVIMRQVPLARQFVWIATADLKDMYVDNRGGKRPFLAVLSELVSRRVAVRLLHAKEPGENFRKDFDRYPNLIKGMERILCPRVHFKSVVVDGAFAYTGSANLTGAGMGAKGKTRRNFEAGVITNEAKLVGEIMEQFDRVWRGEHCGGCRRKEFCSDYKELLGENFHRRVR